MSKLIARTNAFFLAIIILIAGIIPITFSNLIVETHAIIVKKLDDYEKN
jgi:hypothetical protein